MCELWYVVAETENGNHLEQTRIHSKQCYRIIAAIFNRKRAQPLPLYKEKETIQRRPIMLKLPNSFFTFAKSPFTCGSFYSFSLNKIPTIWLKLSRFCIFITRSCNKCCHTDSTLYNSLDQIQRVSKKILNPWPAKNVIHLKLTWLTIRDCRLLRTTNCSFPGVLSTKAHL